MFVFPGIGLGAMVSRARQVTTGMFLAAARALADEVDDERLGMGGLFPDITEVRRVSRTVAEAVATAAVDDGVAEPISDLDASLNRAVWDPHYLPYRPT